MSSIPANPIRAIRKLKGLTMQQVADASGISKGYLSEIESGKKPINSIRSQAIALALDCRISDLVKDAERPEDAQLIDVILLLNADNKRAIRSHASALLGAQNDRISDATASHELTDSSEQ